jgi:hypothetical protein
MTINMKMEWLVLRVVNAYVVCEQKFEDHLGARNLKEQKTLTPSRMFYYIWEDLLPPQSMIILDIFWPSSNWRTNHDKVS